MSVRLKAIAALGMIAVILSIVAYVTIIVSELV